MQVTSHNSPCATHKRDKRIPENPKNHENHQKRVAMTLSSREAKGSDEVIIFWEEAPTSKCCISEFRWSLKEFLGARSIYSI